MTTDYSKKTVAELKDDCKERGLPVTGKKQELIDRLVSNEETEEDALLQEPDVSLEEPSEEKSDSPAEAESPQKEPEPAPTEDEITKKKLSRAERFGLESAEVVEVKKNERAARFGLNKEENEKKEAEDKKRARAERFGSAKIANQVKKSKLEGIDVELDEEKLKKRRERFGVTEETDKKKMRAARFAATT